MMDIATILRLVEKKIRIRKTEKGLLKSRYHLRPGWHETGIRTSLEVRARAAMKAAQLEYVLCLLRKPYHAATAGTIDYGRFEDHARRLAANDGKEVA